MKHIPFTLFFCIILTVKCNNIIDVDDILSESFMPGNLLMLENSMQGMLSNITTNLKRNNSSGNLNDAISTMGFHRFSNFLAEQIVAEMSMPKIRRRLGIAEDSGGTTIKEDMINDEGSKNYKNWLSKSTTLEDIYRHYETDVSKRTDEQSEDKEDDEEYDSRVTGYAYQPSPKQYGPVNNNHNPGYAYITPGIAYNGYNGQIGLNLGQNAYAGIYDNVNTNYGAGYGGIHNVAAYNNIHDGHSAKYHNSGSKEKDLTELLEIASTALAYLSFGIFIIHVIMCVSSVSNNSTTVVTMMPMSMNPSGPEPTGGGMTSDGMMGNGQMTMTGTGGGSMTMTGTGGESMTMPATGGGSMTMTGAEGGSMTMPDTGGGSMTMTGTDGESMTMTDSGNGDMTMTGTGGGSMTMMGMNGESMTGTGEGTMPGTNGGDGMTGNGGTGNGDMPNTGDGGASDGNGDGMTSTADGSTMPGTSDGSDTNGGGDTTMPGTSDEGGMTSTGGGNTMPGTSDGGDNTGGATMPGTSDGDTVTGNGDDNTMPDTGAGTSDGGDTTGTMPGTGDGTDTGGDTTGTMPGTGGGTSDGTDTTGTMTGTGEGTGAGGDTTGGGTGDGMTATGTGSDMTGTGRGISIFNTGTGNGNDITKVHDESSISSAGMIGIGRGLDLTGNDKSMTWTAKRMTGKGVGMGGIQQNGESSLPNSEDGDRIKTSGGIDTIPETIDGTNAQDNLNFRYKRNIKSSVNNNHALNELARRILISIESALVANNDDGMCLRKSLCDNNKYSRTLKTKSKIWIPVWGLGMSWLSGKLTKNIAPATSMLDSLKASILGLGNANCEIIYQDCNLKEEIKTRKRRK